MSDTGEQIWYFVIDLLSDDFARSPERLTISSVLSVKSVQSFFLPRHKYPTESLESVSNVVYNWLHADCLLYCADDLKVAAAPGEIGPAAPITRVRCLEQRAIKTEIGVTMSGLNSTHDLWLVLSTTEQSYWVLIWELERLYRNVTTIIIVFSHYQNSQQCQQEASQLGLLCNSTLTFNWLHQTLWGL